MKDVTLSDLRAYCARKRARLEIGADASLHYSPSVSAGFSQVGQIDLASMVADELGTTHLPPSATVAMHAPGYETLALVLSRAFAQAASGKGAERHAQGEPFTEQVMQDMARRFGVGALLGQAFKKSEESQRLPHERAVAELLGAINYLAGAVIAMETRHNAANDNQAAPDSLVSRVLRKSEAWATNTGQVVRENRCPCGVAPAGQCIHGAGCHDG